jgi:hypothetical protein
VFTKTRFRFKNRSEKLLNIVFEPAKKNKIKLQKLLTLPPHAVKALIEKVWYLTDQEIVEMTNPADHQAGLPMLGTAQKEHLHQEEIQHPLPIKPKTSQEKSIVVNVRAKKDLFHRQESHTRARRRMAINPQAALVLVLPENLRFLRKRNHIQAEQPIMVHRPTKSRLALKADHIQVGLRIMMKDLREVLAVLRRAVSLSSHAVNFLQVPQILTTNQKEARIPIAVLTKELATKNLEHGRLEAGDLKRPMATNLLILKDLNATNHRTIK